jgi:hypothetical protein
MCSILIRAIEDVKPGVRFCRECENLAVEEVSVLGRAARQVGVATVAARWPSLQVSGSTLPPVISS